jgi:hypothetical protein
MADCWKTVPNVVAGKCLEQINMKAFGGKKNAVVLIPQQWVPNPLDHFYHTQMSSCNMFHSIGITSIPITPGSTRLSYAPVAPAAAASYPSERCSDHGRPGSSDSTAVVTRGQWLIYKQIK